MTLRIYLLVIITALTSCGQNLIMSGEQLSKSDINRIQKLNLLDKGEVIYRFYSNFKNSVAGNFFIDRRIAMYWIDERDKTKDHVSFSLYQDIQSIDTFYNARLTYCPYMLITKKDNSTFKVCVDGKQQEIKAFFEEAISKWTQSKNSK
jgi:hypothetical protein